MSENPRTETRLDEPQTGVMRQGAAADWSPHPLQTTPEPKVPRERVFPRKVLIGWALFAVILYFGVRMIGTAIKESAKAAILSSGATVTSPDNRTIIYTTPSGERIRITRRGPRGEIVISRDREIPPQKGSPAKTTPLNATPAKATPAPQAAPAAPAKR